MIRLFFYELGLLWSIYRLLITMKLDKKCSESVQGFFDNDIAVRYTVGDDDMKLDMNPFKRK